MSTLEAIDIEDQPTRESSVLVDDTYSINSDATRQTLTPRPLVDDSCSVHSDTAWTLPSPQPTSRLSRFLINLCCCYSRRRKQTHSAEHLSSNSSQNEAKLHAYVEKLEEEVKTCKDRAQAKQLYKELEDTVSHIKILLSHLQVIISQHSDMATADEHRENLQLLILTSSMSEKLLIQLTEKEDEVHALREQNNKRMQQMKQLEDEKQDQREQAKQFEIDYRVEFEENELLRAENDTLKHQLDSGLECLVDEGDDITGDTGDPKRVISGLKARVKDLNEDVNKLRDHSKQQSRQILKYKQQVEVSEFMEGQLETLERMFHDLKEECKQMHKELMDTKQNLQQNLRIKEELQNEVAALNAQLAVYKADFDQERQDRAEAHSRMAELEKKGARVKGQIDLEREAYHQEHQDLKHDYQIARSQLEQHQLSLSAVEEVNENLRQEIQAKSSQVKQYAKEVDRLKRELEETRNRISKKTAVPTDESGMKQSKLEDLYKTAQDDIQYLSEENSRHQDRIEILEKEIEQLKNLQRISESSLSPVHTPYRHRVVDVNPPEQPLYAEEALHKEPCIHHDPVSPLTGQKQSQLAPQAVHVMVDEVEVDGANPYSTMPLHLPKHPANQILSPEQESVAPKQIQPVQREKVLQADLHAPPVYIPPHVAPLPQPSYSQQLPQAAVMPIQPVNTRNDQPYSSHVSDSSGGDQIPQQSTEVEDNRQLEDSTAQFENPLVKELDDEIHQQAAEVIQEVSGGRQEVKTDHQRPFDPNLVCPMCRRQFRIGEIQKFKRHVNTCTGTDD